MSNPTSQDQQLTAAAQRRVCVLSAHALRPHYTLEHSSACSEEHECCAPQHAGGPIFCGTPQAVDSLQARRRFRSTAFVATLASCPAPQCWPLLTLGAVAILGRCSSR